MQGEVIQGWVIVSYEPTRTSKGLTWSCQCPAGIHFATLLHSDLAYGAVPDRCAECIQQAATERTNERVEERRLAAEFRNMQQQARKEAQVAQQQAGI